ncbi:hypothetical protein KSS93_14725 [Pseudomonas xanthosomatis]|uniref:NEL-type E3 ubiquitin ligase domain-containing protein n=1 Tax=Pseudomonas xanthosomatis TaxID=2842356 RepID=UPI001C3D2E5C|nr:NEL-type E3 ubiquitin ligase domain-containing protein [Pseudomonas xanthosomatis]QXH44154.1 hypothetical protein KSS93_14725 [Pseudomonas xanthosomatis]
MAVERSEAELYQDQLIADRLPPWAAKASVTQMQQLHQAMLASLQARERCAELLAGLQGVEAFARPLLQQAMQAQLGLDEAQVGFRQGHKEPAITSQPIGWPVTQAAYSVIPPFEAALRNFTADQAQGQQLAGNQLVHLHGQPGQLPSAAQFAAFCRTLDLGGQYQRHLEQVLQPQQARNLLADLQRSALRVDAHIAWVAGALDADEQRLITELCDQRSPLKLRGDPVRARRLKLLGCTLEQIVVLDVRDESWSPLYTASRRVIVHIPGDPVTPLRSYETLRQFANDLGKRLRTASYQGFFSRFVRRRDSQAFFAQVIDGYAGVSELANIDLEEHMVDWGLPLFDTLATARIAQIKDDAAQIATPVAMLDREVQQAHDQRLATEGWTLLNLAGLFVPGLGLALLGVAAWQVLGEVYHGFEAWSEGDRSAALDHLFHVATDVAVLAATSAGVAVVRTAWSRAALVDELVPARLASGDVRLARGELSAFGDSQIPAQARHDQGGVRVLGEQAWVQMDERAYAVRQRPVDGRWQLQARNGRAPLLVGNGAGAWRLWSEEPGRWSRLQLFRRLGLTRYPLADEDIEQVLLATDTREEHLRAMHLRGEAPDALMRDCTRRAALDGRIRRMVARLRSGQQAEDSTVRTHAEHLPGGHGLNDQQLAELAWQQRRALFERLYHASQDSQTPLVAALLRAFPGLPTGIAQELLEQVSAVQRQRLADTGRVPLALAEAAAQALRRVRLARVYEGLYFDTPQTLDHARAALGLLAHLPGMPSDLGVRLYDGLQAKAPLAQSAPSAARQFELVFGAGGFRLFDGRRQALTDQPGELFENLAAAFSDEDRNAVGVGEPFAHTLRVLLGRLAASNRSRLEGVLGMGPPKGWFRPPQRLADGRLGYPLSGRGAGRGRPPALYAMVRALYPLYADLEIEHWARRAREAGQNVEVELVRLAGELSVLHSTLRDWAGVATSDIERNDRQHFGEALVRSWQRMGPRIIDSRVDVVGYRLSLLGISLESLPDLPEVISFAHVHELSFRGMGLRQVSRGFLRAFPGVRELELSSNRLVSLPEGLERLAELTELQLYDNQIVLDSAQVSMLEGCVRLRCLNLSFNPLGRTFSVLRMSRLRHLNLRASRLPSIPPALLGRLELAIADLRENHITTLPERFFQTPLWITSSILLEQNPLNTETSLRFEQYMRTHWGGNLGAGAAPESARQGWLRAMGDAARAEQGGDWDALEAEEGSGDFMGLLGRLQDTSDFRRRPAALAERVFCMLDAMRAHTSLREALFEQARQVLTCQDSAALSFSNLELRMLVWQAQADAGTGGEQAALLHLGRQLWRLDRVQAIALEDIAARQAEGRDADQIEVVLAYRIGLRESLDLPAQPGDMTFAEVANVGAEQLEQARAQVLAAQTPERLAESLVDREFWQTWLERSQAEPLAALDEPYQQRLEALLEQAQDGPGGEGEAMERMNSVRDEREAARRALMLQMTLRVLGEGVDKG